jgi:molybdopterin-guanine dinucleotide biosynthesis protein A
MSGRSPAGAILAGGASRRMGTDKALVEVAGRPMVVAVADALWEAGCHPVWCQGGDATALATLGLDVVPDECPGDGPLPAILTALRHARRDLVVAACDLPRLDASTVRALIAAGGQDVDVVVARAGERTHLLSWWSSSTEQALARLVGAGERSYRAGIAALRSVEIDVDPGAVHNVNHPDDLA